MLVLQKNFSISVTTFTTIAEECIFIYPKISQDKVSLHYVITIIINPFLVPCGASGHTQLISISLCFLLAFQVLSMIFSIALHSYTIYFIMWLLFVTFSFALGIPIQCLFGDKNHQTYVTRQVLHNKLCWLLTTKCFYY